MGDLSTIEGLSIFGDDLDLNMQRAYQGRDNDSYSEPNEEYKYNSEFQNSFDELNFSEFNGENFEEINENKSIYMEEEKIQYLEPRLSNRISYPISGSLKGHKFNNYSDNNLSCWRSEVNESINLGQNDDEHNL